MQYIKVLREDADLTNPPVMNKLRHARERMSQHFPLTEGTSAGCRVLGHVIDGGSWLRLSCQKARASRHSPRRPVCVCALPLEDLWREWIEDEQAAAQTEDDYARIQTLFERAQEDYLSTAMRVS